MQSEVAGVKLRATQNGHIRVQDDRTDGKNVTNPTRAPHRKDRDTAVAGNQEEEAYVKTISSHRLNSSSKSAECTEPVDINWAPSHITVQIQQSHSSSPQSQPKQGFETVWTGFLIELPEEPLEGRVQLSGVDTEAIIATGRYLGGGWD